MGLRIIGPAMDTHPLSSGHKQPLKFPIQVCPWALWILRRPQGEQVTSCLLSPSCHWPTRARRKRKDRGLSAWMLLKVSGFQVCRAPPVCLSFWAVCVGPSDHRVDFPLVAQGPKRLSVSKTRASHLVFKDLRVGESPCFAGISTA